MKKNDRWAMIKNYVEDYGTASVNDLLNILDSSPATIRRDINEMDAQGLVVKYHGGIKKNETNITLPTSLTEAPEIIKDSDVFENVLIQDIEKKRIVAEKAAALIKDNSHIFLSAGTTTFLMLDYISAKNLTIISEGIPLLLKIALKGYTTFLLDGEVDPIGKSIQLSDAGYAQLSEFNFDQIFLGAQGVDTKFGFSTSAPFDYQLKQLLMKKDSQTYIVTDSSKLGRRALLSFGSYDQDKLIVD